MLEQTYRINRPDVIDESFDQEYVVVNLKSGTYYSLNPTAALIWESLGATANRSTIMTGLQNKFAIDSELAAAHTDRLLQELAQEQLIVPTDANTSPATSITASSDGAPFTPPLLEKFTDMQALLLLDPIHQVDNSGWPSAKPNL